MAMDWTKAPADIQWEIINRLPLVDYIRFGAVSNQWHLALAEKHRPPVPQSPWLMLPGDDTGTSSSLRFFSLSEKREYRMELPLPGGCWCLGSSEGCLIFIDKLTELHILEPISGSVAKLPSIATLMSILGVPLDRQGRIISYITVNLGEVDYINTRNVEHIRQYHLSKIILSPGSTPASYTAVVIHGENQFISYARTGDKSWTAIYEPKDINDVIFHNQLLYAVNNLGNVIAIDINNCDNHSITTIAENNPFMNTTMYILMSKGELLQVCREEVQLFRKKIGEAFKVFKLDWSSKEWVRVESIGDSALFLGHNCSFSLPAHCFPELCSDCIYFTDDHWTDFSETEKHYLGVYHLRDKRIEPCYPPGSYLNWPPPMWFIPTLLQRNMGGPEVEEDDWYGH